MLVYTCYTMYVIVLEKTTRRLGWAGGGKRRLGWVIGGRRRLGWAGGGRRRLG